MSNGLLPTEHLPGSVFDHLADKFQKVAVVSFEETEITVLLDAEASLSSDDFIFI